MVTRKTIIIFILTVAIFLIATNVQAGWLFIVVAALLAILAISFIFPRLSLRGIEVKVVTPLEAFEGEVVPVQIDVTNRGRWPRYLLRLTSDLFDEPLPILNLPPGKTTRFNLQHRCSRRGFYQNAPLTLRSGFPFGFSYYENRSNYPINLLVYPIYYEISSFPLLEAASYPGEVLHERRAKGAGYDYLGTREYRPGDSLRVVHWRSSARRGQLIVKEFEEELSVTVSIVLDLDKSRHPSSGTSPKTSESCHSLECGVKVAATLAHYVLASGHPLQLFGQDRHKVAELFQPNFWQALEWLAKVEAQEGIPLSEVLDKILAQLKPRSTCIIITPTANLDYQDVVAPLQERKIRVVVVFLDSPSFGASELRPEEVSKIREFLLDRRITVYSCAKGDDIAACLRESSTTTSE